MPCIKSPTLYILRSETSALVTINNVWDSEGGKCLREAFYYGFSMCKDRCNLGLCFRLSVTQEIPRNLFPEQSTLDRELLLPLAGPKEYITGNGPRVCRDGADCWPGHPGQRRHSGHEVWLLVLTLRSCPVIRNIPVKGGKVAAFQQTPSHMMVMIPPMKYINCFSLG